MWKRVLGITNTISETVIVRLIIDATGMIEGGITTIMGKEGGPEIEGLTLITIGIIHLVTHTGLLTSVSIMIDHTIMDTNGGRVSLIANCT